MMFEAFKMSEKLNEDAAPKIVSSLVKALQVVCHGYVEFESNVEIVGYIHINVDRQHKYNYVLNECVNRGDGRSSTFVSNSFYAKPAIQKDGAPSERDRPLEHPVETDVLIFGASRYNDSEESSRNTSLNTTPSIINHSQISRPNKRDVQGNTVGHKTGASSSSSSQPSTSRVPPLPLSHPHPSTDNSYDQAVSDSAKRLRKSNSTDRPDETRRQVPSQPTGSEERPLLDLPLEANIPTLSVGASSTQSSHNTPSASMGTTHTEPGSSSGGGGAHSSAAMKLKEEEDVVLIKEEVCEDELLRACGGPVFPGDTFSQSQSHPPATVSSRGEPLATETSPRGPAQNPDLSTSSFLSPGADFSGASTSYGEPHDTGQSHLYPVSLHANMMTSLTSSGAMPMMPPESATATSSSTATHPAFRSTDALPGRPTNPSAVFAYGRTLQAYSSEDHVPLPPPAGMSASQGQFCEMMELTPGSGICLSKLELSDILQSSCRSNMKYHQQQGPSGPAMARRLLRRFFSKDQLINATIANSPCCDKNNLDPNVINAIVGFCLKHSADSKAKIREAIFWSCSSITSRAKKRSLKAAILSGNPP